MKTVTTARELSALRASWPDDVGFVPTMGGLHEGHLALVAKARVSHRVVVVSIYVNPLQFGPNEDFGAYPRTQEADAARLAKAGVDAVFLPTDEEIYPRGRAAQTQVWIPGLSDDLCGQSRPGHFQGVATVVARLFGLVRPQAGYFGKKDYQQWRIIERMVADLGLPLAVVGVDTMREADGLAKSTRNQYLTAAERARAPGLYEVLIKGAQLAASGEPPGDVEKGCVERLRALRFVPDYVAIRRARDLAPPSDEDDQWVILGAARLGVTRLIDNWEFSRIRHHDDGTLHQAAKAG
ncbi:MAG TPA: pantoate--beta-alanine ligase [Acidiferrobacter sp.]|nr:pantoate--beta-alanine ligase [Acidiferrobacter sp.]